MAQPVVDTLRLSSALREAGVEGEFKDVRAQFKRVDAQFKGVDAQFKEVHAEFKGRPG